jgi:hypothetical protein
LKQLNHVSNLKKQWRTYPGDRIRIGWITAFAYLITVMFRVQAGLRLRQKSRRLENEFSITCM